MGNISHIFVVVPFYNEELTLAATIQSLGFGKGFPTVKHKTLILVNNNSTDSGERIVTELCKDSIAESVFLFQQSEQGIVASRKAGNEHARNIVVKSRINQESILIIQADADTIYSTGYLDAMRLKAEEVGANVMIEAETGYPASFSEKGKVFLHTCEDIDQECEVYFSDYPDDLIIDDKAVAYRMQDYFSWGGHRVIHNENGDEILAETTRLFIAAKLKGASRAKTSGASVIHSVRDILTDPSLVFATAGFPRERQWVQNFRLLDYQFHLNGKGMDYLMDQRRLHLLAIFCVLPAHFIHIIGGEQILNPVSQFALINLPTRTKIEIHGRAELIFEDVFNLLSEHGQSLLHLIFNNRRFCGKLTDEPEKDF
ncbi:glycosyltransferase family A protein [Pedobacter jejuensis]|uniref:Glycosyltransferase family 2 protein n=1 Tax=Pedobacter jejuensis TaxID=1268550 RepID=A0A3N0BPH5_9SPHI|nr:glycosyltransferase family A protein [Pedobacter jejuensis]RNL50533.1 glycosyltransferase family 2 protein [Pedobacter jejuensis]